MATIYLDNLVKPSLANSSTPISKEPSLNKNYTYTDLHLDLELLKNFGNGTLTANTKDLRADYDVHAIRNSIRNIFTTRQGQKILSPTFGCSLESLLFEKISKVNGETLGRTIFNELNKWEPRIDVKKVFVEAREDDNMYYITLKYNIINAGLIDTLEFELKQSSEILSATLFNYQKQVKPQ